MPKEAKKVYFCHYGTVWALTPKRALELADKGIAGGGYNLDHYGTRLSTPARQSRREHDDHVVYSHRNWNALFYNCLDFDKSDWEHVKNEVKERYGLS